MSTPQASVETVPQKEASGAAPGIDRKKRRMEWWKKHKPAKKSTAEGTDTEGANGNSETNTEEEKPKLRNRDTIAKPDSLKYEPNYAKGFHAKIIENLFIDTKKKKKKVEPVPAPAKRKGDSTSPSDKSKKAKPAAEPVSDPQTFDSYSFSLGLINGNVDISKAKSSKEEKKYVLFIGNLPYDVTREQLEEHFRKTGGIKSIRIPRDKATDQGKGFAYMEFDSRISHGIALRLHQTTLGGRKINVEFTSIGGGKSEHRKQKLKDKNRKRSNMKRH